MKFLVMLSLRMGRPPKEILETMSARWLNILFAYHQESPIDDSRQDLQAATIATTVARCLGGSKANPVDFMPFEKAPELTPEQQFEQVARALERSRG